MSSLAKIFYVNEVFTFFLITYTIMGRFEIRKLPHYKRLRFQKVFSLLCSSLFLWHYGLCIAEFISSLPFLGEDWRKTVQEFSLFIKGKAYVSNSQWCNDGDGNANLWVLIWKSLWNRLSFFFSDASDAAYYMYVPTTLC